MKKHVGDFFRRCLTCQQVKAEHQRLAGLLQPLEMAKCKWEHVTMDFVTHLPWTSRGHDAVWVIVDRLTKSALFLAVQMTFILEDSGRLYVREIVDECKTHLCFEFISHAILCILYPYSCKTHKISSKLGFVGLLMKSK